MNQKNQIREIANKLNDLEKGKNNINKISEIMYEYLYNNLNLDQYLSDDFLCRLLLDDVAFDRKGCIGYINYLTGYLTNVNDRRLTYKVWNFVNHVKWNKKHQSLKKIARSF